MEDNVAGSFSSYPITSANLGRLTHTACVPEGSGWPSLN
jgi:hypothetical protein